MAIAFVNAAANVTAGSASSIAAPATSLTTGNLIVVGVRLNTLTIIPGGNATLSDTAGNLYRYVASIPDSANGAQLEAYYASNVTGNAANVVTASFTASAFTSIVTLQIAGLATGSPLDAFAFAQNTTGATITSGALTTTVAAEMLVMIAQQSSTAATWSAGTGFTLATQDASGIQGIEYQVVSTLQSAITPTMVSTNTGSPAKQGLVLTFNASTGGGGSTTTGFASA